MLRFTCCCPDMLSLLCHGYRDSGPGIHTDSTNAGAQLASLQVHPPAMHLQTFTRSGHGTPKARPQATCILVRARATHLLLTPAFLPRSVHLRRYDAVMRRPKIGSVNNKPVQGPPPVFGWTRSGPGGRTRVESVPKCLAGRCGASQACLRGSTQNRGMSVCPLTAFWRYSSLRRAIRLWLLRRDKPAGGVFDVSGAVGPSVSGAQAIHMDQNRRLRFVHSESGI
ncbi:hypothetical protein BD413DRAFT_72752 [Trametes elegans]|nr:hypothetical protein BD413DRAFT_72752 [Trametes elegans]